MGETFLKDMQSVIYELISPNELNMKLQSYLIKYSNSPSAVNFIKKLITDQEKVCRAHTAKHFTANSVTSTRAEGSNSRIKQKGAKKAELRQFNLYQFLEHYLSMVDRQETESLKMIEKLIQNGKQYSEFVHQLWVPEHRQAYHYTCTRQSENVWSASSESGKTRRVEIRDDCSSCDCETFLSTLIPCRHICSAAITMRIDPFNVIYFTCTAFQSMFL